MKATIKDLGFKRFTNFGKYYITNAYTNYSIQISKDEYYDWSDRGLIRKYYPNWRNTIY